MKIKFGFHKVVGRNKGKIASYHLGGGHKKLYRFIDFHRYLQDVQGKIIKLEKDPYRTGHIFLVGFSNGLLGYHLGVSGLTLGDYVEIKSKSSIPLAKKGISCALAFAKEGIALSNIEYYPNKGGAVSRSAGSSSRILKKYKYNSLLKLPSGEYRLFSNNCFCTIGRVNNIYNKEKNLIKAGRSRWLGRRPIVRGRAMNPVDHPHGGRTNGGKIPVTPWGLLAKGRITRGVNKINHLIIQKGLKRRKK